MCFLTKRCPLLVFFAALCCLQLTDTHSHRSRGPTVVARRGSDRTVRELLTPTQLQIIRSRWAAQGRDPLLLEAMFRTNSREFVRNHRRQSGRQTRPLDRPRAREGGFVDRNGLRERNTGPIGHEGHGHGGHDHGSIDRNVNGIGRRGRDRGRTGRGRGRNGISEGSILPDVGQEERIPTEELQVLTRGRSNGVGNEGLARSGRRQRRNRNRLGQTEIDAVGRQTDIGRALRERIPAPIRDQISIRNDGHSHGNEHGHGHGHDHGLTGHRELIGTNVHLANRQRGGIIQDGTRHRTGLDRLRSRTNPPVVPPTNNRRRRRRRLANILTNVVGTLLG
ncbi:uncharacterized protein LOC117343014 [Pecten maximus]|uniref:uncharacterized protein LOC117343014 n=1 Tax=Pecten maximus TaxID=6579 RepID=UPI00145836BB|nr:uncharacterized protein LOC117343014 [Pecten maximus]